MTLAYILKQMAMALLCSATMLRPKSNKLHSKMSMSLVFHHFILLYNYYFYYFFSHDLPSISISSTTEEQRSAATALLASIDLINETVGDAISDMLLVEVILQKKGWDVLDWMQLYKDLPNIQKKVRVQDRNVIQTTDAERKCVSPDNLQIRIDEVVAEYPKGRSFVRPSGTEDVVRVYAEADSAENAEALAARVVELVKELAGGIE